MEVVVRSYRPGDADALGTVFHRAVREGTVSAYSEAERAAWSPELPKGQRWRTRLEGSEIVVAERDGEIVGFMTLVPERFYVDMAFVLPEVMGKGVAASLYAVLEGRARAGGLTHLTVEASLLAEPFFSRQGYRVIKRQRVLLRGERLRNCVMEKDLDYAETAA